MTSSCVETAWDGRTCRLMLNRPGQGNALSDDLVRAIDGVLDECDDRASVLVIEGAGRHFCTGFDLSDVASRTDDALLARFIRIELMLQRVARARFTTVAVAKGRTTGAGADLFAACAHRLAHDETVFAFPGYRGFDLVLGSRRLASRVGARKARSWIEQGSSISSKEALAAGLSTGEFSDSAVFSPLEAASRDIGAKEDLLASALDGNAQNDDARDLAALVRSAARPGLQQRIAHYLQGVRSGQGKAAGPPPPEGATD